ncbi:MAG: hypothetical protein NC038_07530 [Paludibacter sp.]|nr:hypothetical protein [Bacteroidales bacterium]MCM1069749.1 hypothetical protein [Prevotella sp.]MCM1354434.1 hypothetical protein [Bacteroides sp.]MCM1443228.1 hypothetical protein [Muribaculum sp.]MCM1482468.1 hypothetical protein [Paludibacter sp.]
MGWSQQRTNVPYGTYNVFKYKAQETSYNSHIRGSLNAHSLQIPLRAQFTHTFSNGLGVMAVAGPVFHFGVDLTTDLLSKESDGISKEWERETWHAFSNTRKESYGPNGKTDVEEHSEVYYYTWFDFKLGIGAGITFGNLYVLATYDVGLLNRAKKDTDCIYNITLPDSDYRNNTILRFTMDDIKLSVGY